MDNVGQRVHQFIAVGSSERKGVATENGLFVPVLPLFEGHPKVPKTSDAKTPQSSMGEMKPASERASVSSPLLSVGDANLFLDQQCQSLDAKKALIAEAYPAKEANVVLSVAEAWLTLLLKHSKSIFYYWRNGVVHIEQMLRSQLILAIGKNLQPKDFDEFMRHHEKKLFKPQFAPRPFSYAIRRPEHYPDGILSIDGQDNGTPVMVTTRKLLRAGSAKEKEHEEARFAQATQMSFPLNAATSVELSGDTYLHALVAHRFAGFTAGESACKYSCASRAKLRQ
jgi:hypothetical protein